MDNLALEMSAWDSWPCHLSAVWLYIERERCPLHTCISLVTNGRQESWSQNIEAGELALPLICCSIQKSRPHLSPNGTVELVLDVGIAGELAPRAFVWKTQLCPLSAGWWNGGGRNALLPSLIPCHLWQAVKLVPASYEWKNWPCPSPATTCLSISVELALLVERTVSWPQGHESCRVKGITSSDTS